MSLSSHFVEIGARLSPFHQRGFHNPALDNLRYVEILTSAQGLPPNLPPDHLLLHDLVRKLLQRGKCPFPSYCVEQALVREYGPAIGLAETAQEEGGAIEYAYSAQLVDRFNRYANILAPWEGNLADVPVDADHPDNERRLLAHLRDVLGPRLLHCLYPQFELSALLGEARGTDFRGQHGDFLIALPNGSSLILEPGDHDTEAERIRDRQRDAAMQQKNIETVRFRNAQIGEDIVRNEIAPRLERLGSASFLRSELERDEQSVAAESLFLLPHLIARTEWILNDALLLRGLFQRESLTISVIERDLPVFELALWSYLERLSRLSQLYGITWPSMPRMDIYLHRKGPGAFNEDLRHLLNSFSSCRFFEGNPNPATRHDLSLDLAIKCNCQTPPAPPEGEFRYAVRSTFAFDRPFILPYRSRPRAIECADNSVTELVLGSFLRDLFRKVAFREGQLPIIQHVMLQKDTIGLLPTSAGKSICFQLASLLTPGTTLIVSPTTALIDDQVQGLRETYGIDRVLGLHAGAGIAPGEVQSVLSGNLMVFVAPERLLRPNFRSAMQALHAADIYINYAVADEAHCVSMWGHDFRPSYLNLKYNFTEYCTFQGHQPVIVALTGTASQRVLIDLKTVLDITSMDAIVRPKSFNREELSFRMERCPSGEKSRRLRALLGSVANRLGVNDVTTDACGIVFSYTPNELWGYFGDYVADGKSDVQTVLSAPDTHGPPVAICTGSGPTVKVEPTARNQHPRKVPIFPENDWKTYTRRTMAAMKRGDVHLLFGNATVSVGIDCDKINYIVNLRMPQSMEAFYQQCGRAGRKRQPSECVLLFSDDNPAATDRWLRDRAPRHGWDDIGTVAYFHGGNFPGKDVDIPGVLRVLNVLFHPNAAADGRVHVPQIDKHTERYIGYAMILGLVDDYAVTGFGDNTVYQVRLHPAVRDWAAAATAQSAQEHLRKSLHAYFSRYRPCTLMEIDELFSKADGDKDSKKAVAVLVDFIYTQIEQRRVESIRTMVSFCNMRDTSPERLKATLNAYFDRSDKFSDTLDAMAREKLAVDLMATIFAQVHEFEDAENLYWETRRVLDEQFRSDFALINLYAILIREQRLTPLAAGLWREAIQEMTGLRAEETDTAKRMLAIFMTQVSGIGAVSGMDLGAGLVLELTQALCDQSGLHFVQMVDDMHAADSLRTAIRAIYVSRQLKGMLNASRFAQVA